MTPREVLLAFITGSSIIPFVVTILYITTADRDFKGIAHYEIFTLYITLFFGLVNVINVYLIKKFDLSHFMTFFIGGFQGVFFTLLGAYFRQPLTYPRVYSKIIDLIGEEIYSFFFYGLILLLPVNFINNYIGLI